MIFTGTTFAIYDDIGVGARPLGLGGAFVAIANDSNAANYNAAGLAYIEEIQIGATHAQRFNGLITYNTISGIIPISGIGSIGANIGILGEDSDLYSEQVVRLSYAKTIFKQLALGLNLKMLGISYDEENEFVTDNPYFTHTSSSAFSFDVGILTKPVNSLNIGVSIENLLPADISISDLESDTVPQNIRVGLAYNLETIAEMSTQGEAITNLLKGTLGTFELTTRNGEINTHIGVEIMLNKTIGIRGGYGMKNEGNTASTFNLGGSVRIPVGGTIPQIDYGFQLLTGDFNDNITQRFSINLLF
ncbi:PorV/PorQ family protein [Candidatus Poribacteria bacterium]|nr:PorV/PorQ family protein [Candidatus Poribacteria bacterium]